MKSVVDKGVWSISGMVMTGETDLREDLFQFRCVLHMSMCLGLEINPALCDKKMATNGVSYDTAHVSVVH
jgi:hypothetical protein